MGMDDVGVGIVRFFCQYPSGQEARVITIGLDEADIPGQWLDLQTCPSGTWIKAFKQSITAKLGTGDDDALHNVIFYCSSDANGRSGLGVELDGTGDPRTQTKDTAQCPFSMVACGATARIAPFAGRKGDDTAINHVFLACCFSDV
ncbi:vitelline membrane outer layer protein 1 homolog [Penaeus vannamei]|uniref:vitelline membrane outer layer protein 1 homolog n=1 Tax=Penaeus vannamei TaxID=6689 RepID=UPI00387F7D5D